MLILISRLLFMAAVWRVADGKTPLPYESAGTCNNASSEYYVKQQKLCCSRCKPGTHLLLTCTSYSDSICKPCQDGRYSENINHFDNCFSCRKCKNVKGLIYGTNCSADTKAVCICKPGMYCSKRNYKEECEECKKYISCKPGEYVTKEGSPTSDVKCASCPPGKFSNHSNAEQCKPHTECEGRSVLRLGNSTTDTMCEMTSPPTTTTTTAPLQSSSKHPQPRTLWNQTKEPQHMNMTSTTSLSPPSSVAPNTFIIPNKSRPPDSKDMIYYIVIVACVLVLLTLLAVMVIIACKLRKRNGLQRYHITDANKQDVSASSTPDCQHLLPIDRCQKEPSMTSSDSQSQPDSGHSSADWLERTSQESIPEQPSVSSPMVNLSITATLTCQLNPTTACCSIPLNTSARTPHVEAQVPLSQEEVCISCQQEDGKEALQSVQESGLCVF
ncbi:tumor necrosis factor receptor superfamily member 1B-like isoform X2 [Carassius carassius]|uniref:tumor necrosis factor receptor superfamily member 1B-like isoform X2 n=1 Tax=Carassius carassius TaxID=217509 RepID=UPI0028685881|nr:tumor necrosis factor receptor superfamily member 1B-like isoform X2 [Carassius carassius]